MRGAGFWLLLWLAGLSLVLSSPAPSGAAEKAPAKKKKKGTTKKAPPAGEVPPGEAPPVAGEAPPAAAVQSLPAAAPGEFKNAFSSFQGQFFSTGPTNEQCKVFLEEFEEAALQVLDDDQRDSYLATVGEAEVTDFRAEATRRIGILEGGVNPPLLDPQFSVLQADMDAIVRHLLTNEQLKQINLLTVAPEIPDLPSVGGGGDIAPPPPTDAGGAPPAKAPPMKGKAPPAKKKKGKAGGGMKAGGGGDAGGGGGAPEGGGGGG